MALLTRITEVIGLRGVDRSMGLLFGLVRGAILVVILVALAGLTELPQKDFWRDALLRPMAEQGVRELKPLLPDTLAAYVHLAPLQAARRQTPHNRRTAGYTGNARRLDDTLRFRTWCGRISRMRPTQAGTASSTSFDSLKDHVMCGIVGVVSQSPVNQLIYDSLLLLQHRGQDAAGIATANGNNFHMHKANGMVRDVFRTRNMRSLPGNVGIGQVRYPTAGSASSEEEAQPFYVNAPFGIILAHNGNLTNWMQLKDEMFRIDRRHINTASDTEVLLNVFAHELQLASSGLELDANALWKAVAGVHRRVKGSYAIVSLIAGYGLVAFRDPFGIRPLVIGKLETATGVEWMVASESVAIEGIGFEFVRDVEPGEAIFIDSEGNLHSHQCAEKPVLNPCIFELVYLARPDSCLDGVPVYNARLRMGDYLAEKIKRVLPDVPIDVVMPIPDSSRPAAMQVAAKLGVEYREGFFKNRYVGRTFIMPGQAVRKKSVRQKLNAMGIEFKGKNVLIVDDSIVRGTTSHEIVQMARDAGANKVIFASAAPPVKFPNVYGIDMPTRGELVAHGRSDEEVARMIGADYLVYQDVEDLKSAIRDINPALKEFEASCFDGNYITGDVTTEYLDRIESAPLAPQSQSDRDAASEAQDGGMARSQLHLQLSVE
ncbi:Amidophosphoribosyltransferase [Candidatus Paraburkholderia schumanniana]|nr:Amidophosphoribosyltransferase [Candidatus Paraburkholderia schumannianae]